MLLNIDGDHYTAHFTHRHEKYNRGDTGNFDGYRWITRCTFHSGKCTNSKCAEIKDPEITKAIGSAVCNPSDQFSKAKGRIVALTKAMKRHEHTAGNGLSDDGSEFRGKIWAAYFKISPHK